MYLLKSKKASERLAGVLVSLIISLMAGMMFIYLGFFYNPSGEYLAQYYAHDIAATMHAIQAVPGDISITYPLQEGMRISTNEHQIVARHLPTGAGDEAFFVEIRTTPVEDMVAENKLFLAKTQGKISITNDPIDPSQECMSSLNLQGLNKTLSVELATSTKTITKDDLELFKQSFEIQARSNSFDTESLEPSFTILLSTKEPITDYLSTITIRTPIDQRKIADYEHLICELFSNIKTEFILKTEKSFLQSSNYQIEIELQLQEKDKELFMTKERSKLTSSIIEVLSESIEEN